MSDDTAPLLDRVVVSARFSADGRALTIALEGGWIRYRDVSALAMTLGARVAAAEWFEDAMPSTLFTEHRTGLARAEAPRGLVFRRGGPEDFESAPIRDSLAFTGGRWFRLFIGAGVCEVGS